MAKGQEEEEEEEEDGLDNKTTSQHQSSFYVPVMHFSPFPIPLHTRYSVPTFQEP